MVGKNALDRLEEKEEKKDAEEEHNQKVWHVLDYFSYKSMVNK